MSAAPIGRASRPARSPPAWPPTMRPSSPMLDADFRPPPDWLRRGMRRSRPATSGPPSSSSASRSPIATRTLMTRAQSLLVDAHFLLEQAGRAAARRALPVQRHGGHLAAPPSTTPAAGAPIRSPRISTSPCAPMRAAGTAVLVARCRRCLARRRPRSARGASSSSAGPGLRRGGGQASGRAVRACARRAPCHDAAAWPAARLAGLSRDTRRLCRRHGLARLRSIWHAALLAIATRWRRRRSSRSPCRPFSPCGGAALAATPRPSAPCRSSWSSWRSPIRPRSWRHRSARAMSSSGRRNPAVIEERRVSTIYLGLEWIGLTLAVMALLGWLVTFASTLAIFYLVVRHWTAARCRPGGRSRAPRPPAAAGGGAAACRGADPHLQRRRDRGPGDRRGDRARLAARQAAHPGARRLHRRDRRPHAHGRRGAPGARSRCRPDPSHRSQRLQGRRAGAWHAADAARLLRHLRRRLRAAARFPAPA